MTKEASLKNGVQKRLLLTAFVVIKYLIDTTFIYKVIPILLKNGVSETI